MNQFAEYVTGSAFSLQLSRVQVRAMLALEVHDNMICGGKDVLVASHFLHTNCRSMATMHALEEKGLISWNRGRDGLARKFNGLTEAGRLLIPLLKQAGYKLPDMNPEPVVEGDSQ